MKDWLLHARESLLVFLTRKHKWEVCWKRTGTSYCTSSRACDHCTDLFGKKKRFCSLNFNSGCSNVPKIFLTDSVSIAQDRGHATIFFFSPLVLLSKLIRLNPDGGIPGTPNLTAQLDWPTKSESELWELLVMSKSYEKEMKMVIANFCRCRD